MAAERLVFGTLLWTKRMNQVTGHGSAPGADGVRQALKVPESGLVSDPAQELISPTLETPETVLMQMARDALRALN